MIDLKELFIHSGLTLSEVSKLSGISLSTVHRYINGNVKEIKPEYFDPIYKVLTAQDAHEEHSEETPSLKLSDGDIHQLKNKMMMQSSSLNHLNNSKYETGELNVTNLNKTIKRGDIWYVKNTYATGSEMYGSRPALIVSDNKVNYSLSNVMIVYLTKTPIEELPYHTIIKTNIDSFSLCEKITTVAKERLTKHLGNITEQEMSLVEKAMINALGIKWNTVDVKHSTDYIVLLTERNLLREFYKDFMKYKMNE